MLDRVTSLPIAGDDVFGAIRRFYDRLDGVRDLLTDGDITSARLVVNPERMVVAEARRTYTYLSLFGYHVDAVIANRMLPDAISTIRGSTRWKATQAAHLDTIKDAFAPLPVLAAELADHELSGLDAARRLRADALRRARSRGAARGARAAARRCRRLDPRAVAPPALHRTQRRAPRS